MPPKKNAKRPRNPDGTFKKKEPPPQDDPKSESPLRDDLESEPLPNQSNTEPELNSPSTPSGPTLLLRLAIHSSEALSHITTIKPQFAYRESQPDSDSEPGHFAKQTPLSVITAEEAYIEGTTPSTNHMELTSSVELETLAQELQQWSPLASAPIPNDTISFMASPMAPSAPVAPYQKGKWPAPCEGLSRG